MKYELDKAVYKYQVKCKKEHEKTKNAYVTFQGQQYYTENEIMEAYGCDVMTSAKCDSLIEKLNKKKGIAESGGKTQNQEIYDELVAIRNGVEFVMNDANHQMSAVSTFPFYTLEGWNMNAPKSEDMPYKGDTVIGNDVWIGQNAVILPGVHIGDGAIIGANSVVGSEVEPYTIVAGNPAKPIRKRFDDELISLMQKWKWWDKTIDEIDALIPVLTSSDLEEVKEKIKSLIGR